LCLRNGKLIGQSSVLEAGIAINDGKIAAISKGPLLPEADRNIDVDGSILLPGIIDTHVHFRDPGLTHKEDFSTGSMAAAAGGVTTVCDMPNTSPATDSLKRFMEKKKIGEEKSYVDFGLHAMLTDAVEEGIKTIDSGAVSLKLYPEICDDEVISNLRRENLMVTVHPEDPSLLEEKEIWRGAEDFIRSRPSKAEISEVIRILSLVSRPNLHFCHVSTERSLKYVVRGKSRRKLSCEVTPHHILLDRSTLRESGAIAKTYPPLRSERDRLALLKGLESGSIDIVATDHAPHTLKEKSEGLKEAPPGIAGVETSLPLLFTLVRKGKLSLHRLVEAMCTYPGRIFGLRNELGVQKGILSPGADADIVAVDPNRRWEIKGKNLHGKTKFSPFENKEVIGKPFLTLVRGKIVFEEGEIVGRRGHGKFVARNTQAGSIDD